MVGQLGSFVLRFPIDAIEVVLVNGDPTRTGPICRTTEPANLSSERPTRTRPATRRNVPPAKRKSRNFPDGSSAPAVATQPNIFELCPVVADAWKRRLPRNRGPLGVLTRQSWCGATIGSTCAARPTEPLVSQFPRGDSDQERLWSVHSNCPAPSSGTSCCLAITSRASRYG